MFEKFQFGAFEILAQRDRWERLGDRFGENKAIDWIGFMIYGGVFVAFIVGLYLVSLYIKRKEKPTAFYHSNKLFREICNAHSLDRYSRKLLLKLAKANFETLPAKIFLAPDRFETSRLPMALLENSEQILRLKQRLFAD